jgi:DNA processing protein
MIENGAVLSEFWSNEKTEKTFFARRNRIVAGISEATVVVESGIKGGALITAGLAFDYNRDVFAVPGRVTDTYSKGCNELIKKQIAKVLTGADDIVRNLSWSLSEEKPKAVQKQLFVNLSPDEQKIFDFLSETPSEHLDIIALETGMPVSKASQLLMMMELNGIVQSIPGKKFKLA